MPGEGPAGEEWTDIVTDPHARRASGSSQAEPPRPLWRGIATLAAVAVMVITGAAWGKIGNIDPNIARFDLPGLFGNAGKPDDGAIDILMVGVDSRSDAHGNPLSQEELSMLRAGDETATNTDTIILIRIPNNGKSATAISIPRDSYVTIPDGSKGKINGVYGEAKENDRQKRVESGETLEAAERESVDAGRSALIQTVGRLTGVTVDRYAEVSMLGFVLMTDALGGVNVCLNEAVYEPMSGADFPAGPQTLDGPNALSFVRQRHDLPRGDLDRVVRQQVVMSSLAHSALSGGTLTNTTTLGKLRDAITRTVVLSQGWDVMDFIQQLQKLSGGNVAFATIPILREDDWTEDGTQSVVKVDPDQVRSWVSGLLDQQAQGKTEEATYSKDQTTADVVNETQINGLAAAVSELLVGKGFTAGKVGNNESDHVGSSQVQAAQQDDVGAKAVAEALGLPVVEKQGIAEHTVRVVLSKDYQGPGSGRETTPAASETGSTEEDAPPPPPSPIFTAANGPRCVN